MRFSVASRGLGAVYKRPLGSRYITGAEIMLITLIEFTLGPIWVWLVFGEQPTRIALIGGMVVLSAVAARALLMMYQERSDRRP